jgi:hypothetical protein
LYRHPGLHRGQTLGGTTQSLREHGPDRSPRAHALQGASTLLLRPVLQGPR